MRIFLKASFVKFMASLPLASIFVNQWKVTGLMASMFISDFLSIAYIYREAKTRHGVSIDPKDPIRIFPSSIISAIVIFLFNMKPPISITI